MQLKDLHRIACEVFSSNFENLTIEEMGPVLTISDKTNNNALKERCILQILEALMNVEDKQKMLDRINLTTPLREELEFLLSCIKQIRVSSSQMFTDVRELLSCLKESVVMQQETLDYSQTQ